MGTGQDLSLLWSLHFSILTQRSVFGVTCISKLKTKPCFLFCLAFFFVCVDLSLSHFYTNGFLSKLLNFMRGGIIQKLETIQPAEHLGSNACRVCTFYSLLQSNNFTILVERNLPGLTAVSETDWTQISYIGRTLQLCFTGTLTHCIAETWDAPITVWEKQPWQVLAGVTDTLR